MQWRSYRTSILLAVTLTLLLSAFWFFPSLAFIIFISLLLQLLLAPPVEFLCRKKVPRAVSAGIVLIAFVTLLITMLGVISRTFIPTFTRFVTDLPQLSLSLQNIPFLPDSEFLANEVDGLMKEMTNVSVDALKSSLSMIISIFGKFIDFVIVLFVTFYLLKDGEEIKVFLASLFPHRDYERVLNLFNRILHALRIYISSQLVLCAITATVVFSYFTLRGLPYASVFAFVSGISEFIPVLGPTVASAFGTILTATQAPGLTLQTLAFYVVLTQINHNFVYPTLIGKSLNLHPIAIILGIIFGGELLNAAGMFLAVPVIVICKIVIEDIYKDRLEVFRQRREHCRCAKSEIK